MTKLFGKRAHVLYVKPCDRRFVTNCTWLKELSHACHVKLYYEIFFSEAYSEPCQTSKIELF